MSKKYYYTDYYKDIIFDIFSKKKIWSEVNDKSQYIDFSNSYKVDGKMMLALDESLLWIDDINNIEKTNIDKRIKIYLLLISKNEIYIYKEGKLYDNNKPTFLTKHKNYSNIFNNVNNIIFNILHDKFNKNEFDEGKFRLITIDFSLNYDNTIKLLNIDKDPDLSMQSDKLDKMKVHYWIFKDLTDLFVNNIDNGHRWYKCNNKLKKTYKVNTSRILKEVLDSNGYVESTSNDCDFSSWDSYKTDPVTNDFSIIPRKITWKMDDKICFYKTIKENNLERFIPKTYLDFNNIDINPKKIYFLKKSGGSGGKDVHVVNNHQDINNIIKSKEKYKNNYLLQEEVGNLMLIDNKKFRLRCYVLIIDNKEIFLHKDILGIQHMVNYNKSIDRDVHIGDKFRTYFNFRENSNYNIVFTRLQELCFLICRLFIKNETFINKYIILGIDILLDNENKLYILEINTYPNMQYDQKKEYIIKKKVFIDFVNLYVNPKLKNETIKYGDWVICNTDL